MCYTVPVAGAIVTSILWGKTKNVKVMWLNLLFIGGAIFGVIDHLWNGELFLISKNIVSDLILGVAIALAIILCWAIMLAMSKKMQALSQFSKTQAKPV
jgi:drug/metabolite transporter (DMT)-like permease